MNEMVLCNEQTKWICLFILLFSRLTNKFYGFHTHFKFAIHWLEHVWMHGWIDQTHKRLCSHLVPFLIQLTWNIEIKLGTTKSNLSLDYAENVYFAKSLFCEERAIFESLQTAQICILSMVCLYINFKFLLLPPCSHNLATNHTFESGRKKIVFNNKSLQSDW